MYKLGITGTLRPHITLARGNRLTDMLIEDPDVQDVLDQLEHQQAVGELAIKLASAEIERAKDTLRKSVPTVTEVLSRGLNSRLSRKETILGPAVVVERD